MPSLTWPLRPKQRRDLVWALSYVQRSRSRAKRRWHFMIWGRYVLFMSAFNQEWAAGLAPSTCTWWPAQAEAPYPLPHIKSAERYWPLLLPCQKHLLDSLSLRFLCPSQTSVKGRTKVQIVHIPYGVTWGTCLIRSWESWMGFSQ